VKKSVIGFPGFAMGFLEALFIIEGVQTRSKLTENWGRLVVSGRNKIYASNVNGRSLNTPRTPVYLQRSNFASSYYAFEYITQTIEAP
jgi:hypothetical protein